MQCGLLKLNRLLREPARPEHRVRSEPGAPARGRRDRCGQARAGADHATPVQNEREPGWIVSVDNFS
jgi:hypothetical protein